MGRRAKRPIKRIFYQPLQGGKLLKTYEGQNDRRFNSNIKTATFII